MCRLGLTLTIDRCIWFAHKSLGPQNKPGFFKWWSHYDTALIKAIICFWNMKCCWDLVMFSQLNITWAVSKLQWITAKMCNGCQNRPARNGSISKLDAGTGSIYIKVCVCVRVHVLFGLLSVIYLSGVIPMQLADISRGLAQLQRCAGLMI